MQYTFVISKDPQVTCFKKILRISHVITRSTTPVLETSNCSGPTRLSNWKKKTLKLLLPGNSLNQLLHCSEQGVLRMQQKHTKVEGKALGII